MTANLSLDMTVEEYLAAQEKKRQDEEKQDAIRREQARMFEEFHARREAISKREREERLGLRKQRTKKGAAEAQSELIVELLGDRAIAFATIFAGFDAMGVQRHLAVQARTVRPDSKPGQAAQVLIAEAQQRANRKAELAEGAL